MQVGKDAHRLADGSLIDEFARCLPGTAKEGIGRTTDAQAFFLGELQHALRFVTIDGQRLFVVNVFSCFQHRDPNLAVDAMRREVDHQFHIRILE